MDVNGELKFFVKIQKKILCDGVVRGGGGVGGRGGVGVEVEVGFGGGGSGWM